MSQPISQLERLREVMDTLRSPGGCPWDAEQDHESLLKYLLEESYEFIDAVERGDRVDMKEELGDLLLQVFFHARMAEESSEIPFGIEAVAKGTADKLVNRHPHVFGDAVAEDSAAVKANWEAIKAAEKSRTSALDGVAMGQPALPLAAKLLDRAAKYGYELNPADLEVEAAPEAGLRLLNLVQELHEAGIDPEAALRAATLQYAELIRRHEAAREA